MADIPGASVYGQANAGALQAYQSALARINQQRGQTMRSFGYTSEFDPETGVMKNLRVDPNNPYGGYQQMLRTHALNAEDQKNAAMDRGLSASGGLGAQYERNLQYEFGKDSSNLGQQFADSLYQLQDQQNQAKYDYDAALYQAQLEAARNAVSEGDFTDTGYGGDYSEPDYTDYGQYESETPGYQVPGQPIKPTKPKKPTFRPAPIPGKVRVVPGKGPIKNPTRPGTGKAGLGPAVRPASKPKTAPKPAPKPTTRRK